MALTFNLHLHPYWARLLVFKRISIFNFKVNKIKFLTTTSKNLIIIYVN